jgi:hypothetical protein
MCWTIALLIGCPAFESHAGASHRRLRRRADENRKNTILNFGSQSKQLAMR